MKKGDSPSLRSPTDPFAITSPGNPSITEFTGLPGKPWIMRLEYNEGGAVVRFNTKDYPDLLPNDFAKAVSEILYRKL